MTFKCTVGVHPIVTKNGDCGDGLGFDTLPVVVSLTNTTIESAQMDEKQSNGEVNKRPPQRSLDEAISELERELLVRKRCYGQWVKDGKMTRVDAIDRFERHETALNTLLDLRGAQDPDGGQDRGSTDAPLPF